MIISKKAKNYIRILALILVIASVLFVLFTTFYNNNVAYAIMPDTYQQDVALEELDWYLQEDFLNINAIKSVVDGWFNDESFDFSGVEPIVVAVIDTGINADHELFSGKYDVNGNPVDVEGIGDYDVLYRDDNGNIIGTNTAYIDSSKYSQDDFSDDHKNLHGTHVAGIVATLIHALDLEQYIKIMPIKASYVKVGGKTDFSVEAVNNAIDYAIDNGADVVNMSLSSKNSKYGETVDKNMTSKAVFVAAAGNKDGIESGNQCRYPGGHDNIIGVINHNKDNLISSKSFYGEWYDICAPGTDVYSAGGSGDDTYVASSGTSMASPIVAFATALLTLKCRGLEGVSQEHIGANEIAEIVKNSSTYSIEQDSREYPVLDLEQIVSGRDVLFARIKCIDGELDQIIGSVKPVTLEVKILPSIDVVGSVKWYINGQEYSTQSTLIYTPENEVGKTVIEVVWSYSDSNGYIERRTACEINVNYFVLNAVNIKGLKIAMHDKDGELILSGNCRVDEPITFSFSNFNADNVMPDTVVLWYVNGEYYTNGISMNFVPGEFGEYTIQARINGTFTSPIIINVSKLDEKMERELIISSIVMSSLIVASMLTVVVAILIKKKSLKNKVE